jgi:hypothetical protein
MMFFDLLNQKSSIKNQKMVYAFAHCSLSKLTAAGTVSSRLPSVPHSKLT